MRSPDPTPHPPQGARLYTGPMFVKYNAVLRGHGSPIPFLRKGFDDLCMGNTYTTTLHVINSSIVKLSKLTHVTKVYRGVSGGRLPAHFRVANEFGVRGGIDPAFMSTTLDRAVALAYAESSGGPGIVFSIQQGMVDRGADIGWLSQYPHEKEILFAPLGGLEIQKLGVEGAVLVPEVRLSINLNNATIDQVIGRRRKLLQDMGDNMKVEVTAGLSGSGFEVTSVKMLGELLNRKGDGALTQGVMWYNDEENFQLGVAKVIEAKRAALKHEERLRWLMPQPLELTEHADPIVRLLRDTKQPPSVRTAALQALEALGVGDLSRHTNAVVPSLRDADELVRRAAVHCLGHVEAAALSAHAPSIAQIFEQASQQPDVPPDGPASHQPSPSPPSYHPLQASQQPDVRRAAVEALGHLEPGKLAQFANLIVIRLDQPDAQVRKAVVEVMGKLHATSLLAHSSAMLQRIEDEEVSVRAAAVTALGRVLPQLPPLQMKDIIGLTEHEEGGVRTSAVMLLGKLEPHLLKERAKHVVKRVDDADDAVRSAAIHVLSTLEPSALIDHVDVVTRHLSDEDAHVREEALDAIGKLEHEDLIPRLPSIVELLSDPDVTVRQKAIGALLTKLNVEELSEQHIGAIVERIEDADDGVRRAASLWATTKLDARVLGRHAKDISRGLGDDILSVRRASLEALGKVDPGILAQFGELITGCLDDPILSVRTAAVDALSKLRPAALSRHAAAIVARFRDSEWAVRAAAVSAVAQLRPETLRVHLPALLGLLEDAFDGVRSAVVDALFGCPERALVEHAALLVRMVDHAKAPVRLAALSVIYHRLPAEELIAHTNNIGKHVADPDRQVRATRR